MQIKMLPRNKIKEMWEQEHPYYFRGSYIPTKEASKFYGMLLEIAGKTIEVETEYLFKDQFNTVPIPSISDLGMRVMETYIEKVIADARPGKAHCQWCGKTVKAVVPCSACGKADYLTMF